MSLLLPNRYLKTSSSLAVHAAELWRALEPKSSVASAWAKYKAIYPDLPFERFVLTLDVLVALKLLQFDGDFLNKEARDAA
ncbi:ABC-three component system middle component 6 [Streptomyces sp. NPDC048384]|uniref:ABC-three component system middle component 6 n=1 Tax=Streptomyces sp. NPDC048384 TaxID=3155487 RepID=UPI003427C216